MTTAKQILYNLLDSIPENQLMEVIDFAMFIKKKNENPAFEDLEVASTSSIDFWNNSIDDEVWNNV